MFVPFFAAPSVTFYLRQFGIVLFLPKNSLTNNGTHFKKSYLNVVYKIQYV